MTAGRLGDTAAQWRGCFVSVVGGAIWYPRSVRADGTSRRNLHRNCSLRPLNKTAARRRSLTRAAPVFDALRVRRLC